MRSFEERKARNNYMCSNCGLKIPAGTQYICVTDHQVYYTPAPKKLYHGHQYYNEHHSNSAYRYHKGCEPSE